MSGVCVCSSCCDKAAVPSWEFFLQVHCLVLPFCVSRDYVCSSCYDKVVVRSGKVVVLSLFVHCFLLPLLSECGLCLLLMLR